MSYKEKKRHGYYGPSTHRRGSSTYPFKTKKTVKKEFCGFTLSKNTEEMQYTHVPAKIEEGKENSFSGNVNNGAVGLGGSVTNKDSTKTEFDTKKFSFQLCPYTGTVLAI